MYRPSLAPTVFLRTLRLEAIAASGLGQERVLPATGPEASREPRSDGSTQGTEQFEIAGMVAAG